MSLVRLLLRSMYLKEIAQGNHLWGNWIPQYWKQTKLQKLKKKGWESTVIQEGLVQWLLYVHRRNTGKKPKRGTEDTCEVKTKNFSQLLSNIKIKIQEIQTKFKNSETIPRNII